MNSPDLPFPDEIRSRFPGAMPDVHRTEGPQHGTPVIHGVVVPAETEARSMAAARAALAAHRRGAAA